MLTIGAKELRVPPFLPTLAATAPGMWKDLGHAAELWWELRAGSMLKGFLFEKSCKQGISSEVESSPCLLRVSSFLSKISWMINSPRTTVVKHLVGHVDASKYPEVWHQGRRKKNPYDGVNLSFSVPMF